MRGSKSTDETNVGALATGIIEDAETLVRQQFDLLRQEVREEIQQAKAGAISLGAGAGLLALAGFLSGEMLVHLLHRSTRLPLWSCYGVVGGLAAAAGTRALNRGFIRVGKVGLLPHTTQALRQNVTWLKEQTSGN
jgi:hypothetical protein